MNFSNIFYKNNNKISLYPNIYRNLKGSTYLFCTKKEDDEKFNKMLKTYTYDLLDEKIKIKKSFEKHKDELFENNKKAEEIIKLYFISRNKIPGLNPFFIDNRRTLFFDIHNRSNDHTKYFKNYFLCPLDNTVTRIETEKKIIYLLNISDLVIFSDCKFKGKSMTLEIIKNNSMIKSQEENILTNSKIVHFALTSNDNYFKLRKSILYQFKNYSFNVNPEKDYYNELNTQMLILELEEKAMNGNKFIFFVDQLNLLPDNPDPNKDGLDKNNEFYKFLKSLINLIENLRLLYENSNIKLVFCYSTNSKKNIEKINKEFDIRDAKINK